ncbi:hypothetical protein HDF18_23800 [Mucilaginibacter sp. X5P1]|uniref:hypothetical protein n=1 Tax=Mucilaginibacter sp. X5P1 TaxID=2723088 RepID=UPI00161B8B55|nr:hypothetical protein [Mucilaginibacter sp. X5P1]MBB6141250.1 hypothetical protein [Mucilaginibacter sp. X5P1]
MLSDLRKSISYIVYERTTSPFWGSFIFSWLICNWKIVFTVFVVSEDKLSINKIDYISQNFISWQPLFLYPLVSTLIIILFIPLLSNGAYWISIIYDKWKADKKNEVEKKQLLSIEQSIAIRISNAQTEERYSRLVSDKESEIKTLNLEIEELNKRLNEPTQVFVNKLSENVQKTEIDEWTDEYNQFKTSSTIRDFDKTLIYITANTRIGNYDLSLESLTYFISIGLIKLAQDRNSYELTTKGMYFSKLYNQNKYKTK